MNMTSENIHLLNRDSSSNSLRSEELSEHDSHEEGNSLKRSWTREQVLTAVVLVVMTLVQGVSFGVLTPFFPSEAAGKGASPVAIGLVFGVFQLVMFITSPIYGSQINNFGAKAMCLYGCLLIGGCNILFGFLDRCPDGPVYIAMCFMCRIVEGNGAAMQAIAAFALLASAFPKDLGTAAGLLETALGVGMVLGPSIGGALYGVGGFLLPLVSIGGLMLMILVIAFFTLPSIERTPPISGSIVTLLKIPGCLVVYLVIMCCGISLSYLDPNFSPFMLKRFPWITIPQIGLIFSVGPGVYAVMAPAAGYISDKWSQGVLCLTGLLVTACAFLLLGPNPWLAKLFSATISETIIALVLTGLGISAVLMPIFPLIFRLARNKGFPEDIQTFGLISGLFSSALSLGSFLGPTVSGVLTHKYGFAWCFSTAAFINLGVAALLFTYMAIMRSRGDWPIPIPEENDSERSDNSTTIIP